MNNKIFFFRHGKTLVDNTIPIADWILTPDGKRNALKVVETGVFDSVDIIFSSEEIKAVQTAQPLAKRLNKNIIQVKELGELYRPTGHLISLDKYNELKKKMYSDFDFSDDGWETLNHALARFKSAVAKIDALYENKTLLLVTHGTVMTLFFASLQNSLDNMYYRWKSLGFCDWGCIKNGLVTKDIL